MRKLSRRWYVLLAAVLILALASGCGGGGQATETEEGDPGQQGEEQAQGSEDLGSLLGKAGGITSLSYDIEITSYQDGQAGPEFEGKFWIKGKKYKQEITVAGEKSIVIFDGDKNEGYIISPATNSAMKMTTPPEDENSPRSPLEEVGALEATELDGARSLGREEVDGKECSVWEFSSPDVGTATWWVWEEYGIPIKMKTELSEGFQSEIVYKNIAVNNVSDAEFEIPEGLTVLDLSDTAGLLEQLQQ